MQPLSNNRKILAVMGFLVLGIFGLAVLTNLQNKGDGVDVEIFALPRSAKLTINGKGSGSKARLIPGQEYTFGATATGFDESENTVFIDRSTTVVLILEAVSDEAKEYERENQNLYLEAEGIVGRQAQERGVEFVERHPILRNLPQDGGYYRIDYKGSNDSDLVILITSHLSVGRQVALEKIRSWGYEPHDYRIEFPGFDNPFNQGGVQ